MESGTSWARLRGMSWKKNGSENSYLYALLADIMMLRSAMAYVQAAYLASLDENHATLPRRMIRRHVSSTYRGGAKTTAICWSIFVLYLASQHRRYSELWVSKSRNRF